MLVGPNHALLVGELVGHLSPRFAVRIEQDDQGTYTNRIFIERPSGVYVLTVEPPSKDDDG